MVVSDLNRITDTLSPDTPVIFYNSSADSLSPDTYCDGVAIRLSELWSAREGWRPCVTVDLGEEC